MIFLFLLKLSIVITFSQPASLLIVSSLSQNGVCQVKSPTCELICTNGIKYDLCDVATKQSGSSIEQRYFSNVKHSVVNSESESEFQYAFSIPICGNIPSESNFPVFSSLVDKPMTFSFSIIWKWSHGRKTTHNNYLGLYNASSWVFGYYNGLFALGYGTYGDQPCNDSYRQTTIYLQCNKDYTATNPLIIVKEVSICVCKSLLFLLDYILSANELKTIYL